MNLSPELIASITPEVLKSLSNAELLALADSVSKKTGEEIVKDSTREEAVALNLADDLAEDWSSTFDPVSSGVLSDLPEKGVTVALITVALSKIGNALAARDLSKSEKLIDTALTVLTGLGRKKLKAAATKLNPKMGALIGTNLSLVDESAVKVLSQHQLWWIGNFWDRSLSTRILETVKAESMNRGLGRVEVGRILRGIVEGNHPAVAVPKT